MATIQKPDRHLLPEFLRSPSLPTLLILCALAIGAAALLPLVQSSIATTTNGNVHRLEQQRDDWQARVQEREVEVATLAGLDRIEEVAKSDLKMVEPKGTLYITVDAGPPDPPTLPHRFQPADAEESASQPAFWEQILDRLPLP